MADPPPTPAPASPQGLSSTAPSANTPLPAPSGGSGVSWHTVTIDVGPIPTPSAAGTFPHPGLTVGTEIMALVSPNYPESKDADEWEMGDLGARLVVLVAGQVSYVVTGRDGYLAGAYNINYIIGG